jgi:hypothetical protein
LAVECDADSAEWPSDELPPVYDHVTFAVVGASVLEPLDKDDGIDVGAAPTKNAFDFSVDDGVGVGWKKAPRR